MNWNNSGIKLKAFKKLNQKYAFSWLVILYERSTKNDKDYFEWLIKNWIKIQVKIWFKKSIKNGMKIREKFKEI
jgi:hypothetical protein